MLTCRFQEFHYTGNHPRGENSGNYDDMEVWLKAAGLTIVNDDLSMLLHAMAMPTGVATLTHRGKVLRYHGQVRRIPHLGTYGYTTITEYRLISCDRCEGAML